MCGSTCDTLASSAAIHTTGWNNIIYIYIYIYIYMRKYTLIQWFLTRKICKNKVSKISLFIIEYYANVKHFRFLIKPSSGQC